MNKLQTKDVWVETEKESFSPLDKDKMIIIRGGIEYGFKKQSGYFFTKEELEAFARKCIIQYANYHLNNGTLKSFIDNLLNP